jgi:PIN domain nuclease of toxin-antitoxin system
MKINILFDTCAALWTASESPLADSALHVIQEALDSEGEIFLSPITAWEIGMLTSKGRLRLAKRPEVWFADFIDRPGMALAEMSPDLLIESSHLPGVLPADPADRIIAATAREYGLTLVTRDKALLRYAEDGYINAIQC